MSNQNYNTKWAEAANELMELYQLENLPAEQPDGKPQPEKSESEWFQFYANLYVKYIKCYRTLEDSYDQIVHPQKRTLLKDMLENSLLRVCELKRELVQFNTHHKFVQSDFINLDEMLMMDLKLNLDALELSVPRYFREEEKARLDERDRYLDECLLKEFKTKDPEEEIFEEPYQLDIDKAMWLIQKCERGRQGIERAMIIKSGKRAEQKKIEKQKKLADGLEITEGAEKNDAIEVIQKYFRGFKARQAVEKLRLDEMLFLGMTKKSMDPKDPNSEEFKVKQVREKRKFIQARHEIEYKEGLEKSKKFLEENDGPEIKEHMLKGRRDWILDFYNKFENYPEKAEDFYKKDEIPSRIYRQFNSQTNRGR